MDMINWECSHLDDTSDLTSAYGTGATRWYFLTRLKLAEAHACKGECMKHLLLIVDCLSATREYLLLVVQWLLDTREHLLLAMDFLSVIREFIALKDYLRNLSQIGAQTRRELVQSSANSSLMLELLVQVKGTNSLHLEGSNHPIAGV